MVAIVGNDWSVKVFADETGAAKELGVDKRALQTKMKTGHTMVDYKVVTRNVEILKSSRGGMRSTSNAGNFIKGSHERRYEE